MAYIDWSTIEAILKLDPQNQKVIDFLIDCLKTGEDSFNASNCLEQIGEGNKLVIESLVNLLQENTEIYNNKAYVCLKILAKIDSKNQDAIGFIERWLKQDNSNDYYKLKLTYIDLLNELDNQNNTAVKELIKLIEKENKEFKKRLLIEKTLSKICPQHPLILEHYFNLLNKSDNIDGGYLRDWLKNVEPNCDNNDQIIEILVSWMLTLTKKDYSLEYICQWLAKVDFQNEQLKNKVIETLIHLLNTVIKPDSFYISVYISLMKCLGEIAYGNQKVINYLSDWNTSPFIKTKIHDYLDVTLETLAKIAVDNEKIIDFLLSLIEPDGIFRYKKEKVFDVISQIGIGNQHAINSLIKLTYEKYNEQDNRYKKKEFYQNITKTFQKITIGKNELISQVTEAILWWINNYQQENNRLYYLYNWSIEIEALTNIAPQNQQVLEKIASFILNSEPSSWWDNYSFNDGDEKCRKAAIDNLIVIGKDQPPIIKAIGELIKKIHNDDDWKKFLELLLKIDSERKITLAILLDIFNNCNKSQVSSLVIDSLSKFNIEDESILRSLVSALIYKEEYYTGDNKNLCKYLETSNLGKQIAIETLSPLLQQPETNYTEKEDIIKWLIKTAPAEEKVIDVLYYWLDSTTLTEQLQREYGEPYCYEKVEEEREDLTALWLKNAPQYKVIAVKNLEQRLKVLENNFQTIESALLLWQIAPNNDRALDAILFLFKHPDTNDKTLARLIEILDIFQKQNILSETMLPQQLQKIVAIISQLLNNISSDNYDDLDTYYYHVKTYKQILWYCTKNLSYPNFYQAYTSVILSVLGG